MDIIKIILRHNIVLLNVLKGVFFMAIVQSICPSMQLMLERYS